MKMTLTFDLPEERSEAERAAHGTDWYLAVYDIVSELRSWIKFQDAGQEIADFNTWVWEMLNERGLDPYKE